MSLHVTEAPPAERAPAGPRPEPFSCSVEPTATTYLIRRVALLGVVLSLVAAGAAGSGLLWPVSSLVGDGPSATPPPPSLRSTQAQATADPTASSQSLRPVVTHVQTTTVAPAADAVPPLASRLVVGAPERVLDTRGEASPPPAGTPHSFELGGEQTAVVVSISVIDTTEAGSVIVDGGTGPIDAIAATGPGVTASNLVIVPVSGNDLMAWSSAGGHLTIDVVGRFEASGQTAAGRYVAGEPTEVARLMTTPEGGDAVLAFDDAVPGGGAGALLVVIEADVGVKGASVRFGPGPGQYDQTIVWGPTSGQDRSRRGLALVRPGPDGTAHLRYEGGAGMKASVVGYFTDDRQPTTTDGLFVPSGPQQLFGGRGEPDGPVSVRGLDPQARLAFLTVASSAPGPGRLSTALVPVTGGQATLPPPVQVESVVTLLGVFIECCDPEPVGPESGDGRTRPAPNGSASPRTARRSSSVRRVASSS